MRDPSDRHPPAGPDRVGPGTIGPGQRQLSFDELGQRLAGVGLHLGAAADSDPSGTLARVAHRSSATVALLARARPDVAGRLPVLLVGPDDLTETVSDHWAVPCRVQDLLTTWWCGHVVSDPHDHPCPTGRRLLGAADVAQSSRPNRAASFTLTCAGAVRGELTVGPWRRDDDTLTCAWSCHLTAAGPAGPVPLDADGVETATVAGPPGPLDAGGTLTDLLTSRAVARATIAVCAAATGPCPQPRVRLADRRTVRLRT